MEISKTADQALVLLLRIADQGAQTPVELARTTGMNRTVVHRLLATLQGRGFVFRRGDRYALGAALMRMAGQFEPELRAVARGVMTELAEQLHETLVLAVREDDQVVIVEQVAGAHHLVRVQYELGYRHPITLGASGLALLAFLGEPEREALAARTEEPERITRRLTEVRALGYAITHDELRVGAYGLAVPVRDGDGEVVASLAVIVPTTRTPGFTDHAHTLAEAAERMTKLLAGAAES